MTQSLTNATNYIFTEFPESREFVRLTNGVVNTLLHSFEINTLFGANIAPIGELAKGLDGFYSLGKTMDDFSVVVLAFRSYDSTNHKESLHKLFDATVKCAGDLSGACRWLGTFGGVVILSRHANSFGYVKNVCAIYSASITLIESPGKIYAVYHSTKKSRKKEMEKEVAKVITSLCGLWLNGMGGLSSYVGKAAFVKRGLEPIKPWTFNAAVIVSSGITIAQRIAGEQ